MVVGPRYKGAPKIMMKNSFRIFLACCTTLFIVLIYSTPPSTALAPSSGFDANGNGRDIDTEAWEKETNSSPAAKGGSYQPHSSNNNHQPTSDSKRLNARPGFALSDHCERPLSYRTDVYIVPVVWRCGDLLPSDETWSEPPSTLSILRSAAATIHANDAGIHKLPIGVSYTNKHIPTIVNVTNPTQTHVINLLGRDITITLTATNYEWNWGDGTPNTITTSPGVAWEKGIDPNNDPRLIRHYYTPPQGWRSMLDGPYPHEDRDITLTTTWSGTATNPFTGETQTINGLVTTTETTGKFPLSHLVINNTDTWEEKQGH